MFFGTGQAESGSVLAYEFHWASGQSLRSRRDPEQSTGSYYLLVDILAKLSCLDIPSCRTTYYKEDKLSRIAFRMVLVRSREKDTAHALVTMQ